MVVSPTKVFYPSYPNKETIIAALIFFPKDFDESEKYPAIIVNHPWTGCKEQTATIYAKRLTELGYVALAPDATYQGESGGVPKYIEYPPQRVQDTSCAIDYLVNQRFIDEERIGVLGICGGGGYSATATMMDRRIKALGTVSGVSLGRLQREGASRNVGLISALEAFSRQRTLEAKGANPKLVGLIPDSMKDFMDSPYDNNSDIKEATEYYRTPRGQALGAPNRLVESSFPSVFLYDAYNLADKLLTQPLAIVVGDKVGDFGSYRDGYELFNKAASTNKFIFEIADTSHFDLYDKTHAVDAAMEHFNEFFEKYLKYPV